MDPNVPETTSRGLLELSPGEREDILGGFLRTARTYSRAVRNLIFTDPIPNHRAGTQFTFDWAIYEVQGQVAVTSVTPAAEDNGRVTQVTVQLLGAFDKVDMVEALGEKLIALLPYFFTVCSTVEYQFTTAGWELKFATTLN